LDYKEEIMSCGTRLSPRWDSWSEREELGYKLEREGEYQLADKVRHGDCLDYYDLNRAKDALDRQGLHSDFDYEEERCHCSTEEEQ
jgi:hypothetical protein